MPAIILTSVLLVFLALTFIAWRRYLWASERVADEQEDTCPYSLTDVFGDRHLVNVPHQEGSVWLTDIFSRTARRFPQNTALQIPHTGESLSYAELDARAEMVASALAPLLSGPDQVVAVAMEQDNWQIVAAHLGVLKAGGTLMFLDTSLPEALIDHMLEDAQPVAVLTRGLDRFRDLPTLDLLSLPGDLPLRKQPAWLDDPAQRLATLFYTSGTTGMPKGVECPHAGYVNLALSYADYFDLVPGMDATTLTSSLGYDGSISEMYSAWVSGCAVVMLTKEEVRSGPDLLPVLRDAEVTVLFCPPVLLTTLTHQPELDLPYPICRYIVPAGEAFPASLVEPWTRCRRQVINTYGPTEASTDTSRQSLRPGEPVTIGSPFANVTYLILEPDQLQALPHGQVGELCIGGIHVGRGYRNLPQQTQQKFIEHPEFGRLFRTGDKCKIDSRTQRVHFLGRIDAQLKVRGHRVEIQPVEDILLTQFAEIESAVLDYQNAELIAFVVAPSLGGGAGQSVSAAPVQWVDQVTAVLARQLPEPSVPTRVFLVDEFVLDTRSGKIDRKQLPSLTKLLSEALPATESGMPGSPDSVRNREAGQVSRSADEAGAETDCVQVLEICRSVFETSLELDDVFAEHGGHSIVVARLAQLLQAVGWPVPVRALLSDCNTPRKVACHPRQVSSAPDAPVISASPKGGAGRDEKAARVLSAGFFTFLQAVFLLLLYSPPLIGFLGFVAFSDIGEFFLTAYFLEFVVIGLLMYVVALVLPFASLLWVLLIKLLMGGSIYKNNVTPGVYPKWSRMHLRIWCIERLERSVLRPLRTMFRSAPLMAYVLRRLGAQVGTNLECAHDAEFFGPLDLLTLGDDVGIQTRAYIRMTQWSGQDLRVGPVCIESGSKIGMRSGVAANVTVGSGSWINPFTPILKSTGSGEIWEGAPARLAGRCVKLKRTANHCQPRYSFWIMEMLNILMQAFLDFWLFVVPTAAVTWFAATFISGGGADAAGEYFRITPLAEIVWKMGIYAFITTWVTIVLISLMVCLFIRFTAASPGVYSPRSLKGSLLLYRMKKMNQLQSQWTWTISGQYLRALAGLRFPRVGASECDVMFNLVPELASADSQVFWSNGSFTNMLDYDAKSMLLRQLDMPRNFFSGNNSVAEYGQYPSNFLLGVSTPGNDIQFRRQMRSRPGEPITVAGNPPVQFSSAQFEAENESHKLPGFPLFLVRVFLNDIFSIGILRGANVLVYVIMFSALLRLEIPMVVSALLALISSELTLVVFCAVIKKLLVGSQWGAENATPFWSWRHFSYFFAQDVFFAWCGRPLRFSAGTTMSNTILRWMGCRIGKRTIIASPLQASDWNAVSFGDDCVINGFLQFHTFEDMMLKIKRCEIRNRSTVAFGATVMGGAVIEDDTTVLPLSLVLKEMYLPTATYQGSPVGVLE